MTGITIYRTAELPDWKVWWLDDDGTLINFSTGYTFELKVGRPGSAASFTKTSGITGAAGSGTETSGTPNLTITFTATELDVLTRGRTTAQLTATATGGKDRKQQFPLQVLDVVT
jgi:hypothetical protein